MLIQIHLCKRIEGRNEVWQWRLQCRGSREWEAQLIFDSLPKGERWWSDDFDVDDEFHDSDDDDSDDDDDESI